MTSSQLLCAACRPAAEATLRSRHGGALTLSWVPLEGSILICGRCFTAQAGLARRPIVTRQRPVAGRLEWTIDDSPHAGREV